MVVALAGVVQEDVLAQEAAAFAEDSAPAAVLAQGDFVAVVAASLAPADFTEDFSTADFVQVDVKEVTGVNPLKTKPAVVAEL